MDDEQQLNTVFTTVIRKDGAFPTYLELERSHEILGTRRAVKITGTVDGHDFSGTLMPSGSEPHWLPLRAAVCKQIGKSHAGEEVTVHLQRRHT